ncbi:MAG TPA: ABC transporter permease [Candidatus Binatus sp.]|nr:ABC transporter permease [Candidatus Binatus sp.]HWY22020.1 ABC transporter permease [Candidatus Acidoferrum sp.]
MNGVIQDVRYALRQLRRNPGFTVVAVLTLTLGIGANTGIFSVVQAVVLAPLRFFEPDRLVMIWENNPRFPRVWDSYPNFQDWQRNARSFQRMAAFRQQGVDLTFPGTASHLNSSQISLGFFSTLGVELALGREFSPQEDQHGGAPAVVISHRLWRERFAGTHEVLGRTVTVDGLNYAIVGVAPPEFRLEEEADIYTPLGQSDPLILNNRASHAGIFTIARLKPGVSASQGQAEMSTIQNSLDRQYPGDNRDLGTYVEPLKQAIVGDAGQTLGLLLGAVGLVSLIACANVANLLLARSAARNREFAIRSALGASRARVARQLLTESLILSLAGAGLGIVIAFLGIRSLLAALPGILPRSEDVGVNAAVLLYTLAVSLVAGILFGLSPALKSWSAEPQASLKEGGRGSTVAHRRTQSSFVVMQVALTLVLLVGAGLLFRTILRLRDVNPGFETKNIVTFKVGVSHSLTKTASSTRIAYRQLLERIRQIPGVQAADFTTAIPLTGQGGYLPFWIDSQKPESLQGAPRLQAFLTGPDYFRTMEIPLLQGRFLSEGDTTKSPCVAVIDSEFARKFFPDGKSIGHTITAGFAAFGPCTIVGVAGHVKDAGLNDAGVANQYQTYYSLYQDPDQWVPLNYSDASIIVRTPLAPATVIPAIKAMVYQAGTDQPIYNVQTMRQIVADSMSGQRFPMLLLGSFAGLALLLAAVGIYGTISYSVTRRVQEIGIRMALGADKQSVLRLFIGHELKLVLAGIAVGAVGALILTRMLSSLSHLLYGVRSSDPLTFVTVSAVLMSVAGLAGYIPARRAMKVDPIVALRYE